MKKLTNYLILALALVAGAGLASSCGKDYGDDISKLDKRVAAIEQQNLADVKSQLNQLSSTLNGITGTLSSIQSKNGELEGLVNGLSSTVGTLQSTISGLVSISDFNEFKSSYETEKGELPNIFPAEFVMRDKIYKPEKTVRLRIDRRGKFVFDRNARLTILFGLPLCAALCALCLMSFPYLIPIIP